MRKKVVLEKDAETPLEIAILREIMYQEELRKAALRREDAESFAEMCEKDIQELQKALTAIREAPWEN